MAEIKIKKKSPVWPWILLIIIILAALAYYFMVYNDDNKDADVPNIGQNKHMDIDIVQIMGIQAKDYHYSINEIVA